MKTLTLADQRKKAKLVANIVTAIIGGAALLYMVKGVLMQAQHLHIFGF